MLRTNRSSCPRALLLLAGLLLATSCGGGGGGGGGRGPVGPFNNAISGTILPGGAIDATSTVTRTRSGTSTLIQIPTETDVVPGEAVVWLEEGATAQILAPWPAEFLTEGGPALVAGGPSGRADTLAWIEELAGRPGIARAEPNRRRFAGQEATGSQAPNDPVTVQHPWNFDLIRTAAAWRDTLGDSTVVVAVVDTGVGLPGKSHPDLTGQLLPGHDFVNDDSDPTDVPGGFTHGTAVTGIIAAVANNSIGIAGIAPGIRILPVRVLGPNGGTDFDVARGILWAAGISVSGVADNPNPARVINLSLGGGAPGTVLGNALRDAADAGVVIVAAAGNDSGAVSYPASDPEAIAVSALTPSATLAWYSNRGEEVELAAPGGAATVADQDVWSTAYTPVNCETNCTAGYTPSAGTSMAAPHVSAVAALVISAYPDITAEEVRTVLTDTAVDLGDAGRDTRYGYGLVDAGAAVTRAILLAGGEAPPVAAVLAARTSAIRVTPDQAEAVIRLTNLGDGDIALSRVEVFDVVNGSPVAGPDWITAEIESGTVDSETDGIVGVTVEPSLAGTLSRQALIVISSDTDEVTVPVFFFPDAAPDPGEVIVRAVDANTGVVAARTVATKADGYAYELTELPPGNYYLEALTDLDGDGLAIRPDEWAGSWPTTDRQIVPIDEEEEVRGLDIPLQQLAEGIHAGTGGGPAAGVLACLVRSDQTGLPIQGARIVIGDGEEEATTDARGLVFFSDATGPRTVTATSEGFGAYTYIDADVSSVGFNLRPTRLDSDEVEEVTVTVSGLFSWEYAVVMAGFGDSATVTSGSPQAVLEVHGPAVVTALVFSSFLGNVAIGHAEVTREILNESSPSVGIAVQDYPDSSTVHVDISGSDAGYDEFWLAPGILGGNFEQTYILGLDDSPGFGGVLSSPVKSDPARAALTATLFVFAWDASREKQGLMLFRDAAGELPGQFLTASLPAPPELTTPATLSEGSLITFTASAPRSFGELTLKRNSDGYTWTIRFGPTVESFLLPEASVLPAGEYEVDLSLLTSEDVTYESLENLSSEFREALAALDVVLYSETTVVTVP